jgi:hypothetical protein
MTATTDTALTLDLAHGDTVRYDGDTWKVLGVGAKRAGETYLHLASTTRSVKQRNGQRPIQVGAWIWNENVTKVTP